MVELVPMAEAEFRAFRTWLVRDYAREGVRFGRWTEAEAVARSEKDIDALLPDGSASPEQYLRTLRAVASGPTVGTLWYARRPTAIGTELFVYWIGIEPEFRRKGYAQAAFAALEEEARRLGAVRIGLHVFGDNAPALALYARLGFHPVSVQMARPVPAQRPSGPGGPSQS